MKPSKPVLITLVLIAVGIVFSEIRLRMRAAEVNVSETRGLQVIGDNLLFASPYSPLKVLETVTLRGGNLQSAAISCEKYSNLRFFISAEDTVGDGASDVIRIMIGKEADSQICRITNELLTITTGNYSGTTMVYHDDGRDGSFNRMTILPNQVPTSLQLISCCGKLNED